MLNLICSSNPSDLNKKLIKFFNLNLQSLNKANLVFKFEVAHPNEASVFVKRGIKNYPVLINNQTSVSGAEKIIRYLKVMVDKYNKRITDKSSEDIVDDYMKSTLGKYNIAEGILTCDSDDDNDDDDGSADMQRKLAEAFQQRNESLSTKPKKTARIQSSVSSIDDDSEIKNNENPADTLKRMKGKNKGREGMDDDLMAQFFENQGL
jgi:hypothetical protein